MAVKTKAVQAPQTRATNRRQ